MMRASDGIIRLYKPGDEVAIHTIAADTARFGEPVEEMMDDRRLFIDAFVRVYTESYPHTCWVAEVDGEVVGYLTGCMDTKEQEKLTRRQLMRVVANALRLRYRLGIKTLKASLGFLLEVPVRPRPELDRYPAHLHINVADGHRGRGLGKGLLSAFIEQCREAGLPGIHLSTSEMNTIAVPLYRKMGFKLLRQHISPFFTLVEGKRIRSYLFGLDL